MNREILFRAKRIDNGEWVEGSLVIINNGDYFILPSGSKVYIPRGKNTICSTEFYKVVPSTLCQYTGLTDKNSKKIWENDIYQWDEAYSRCTGIIRFGEYPQDGSGNEYSPTPCCGFYVDVVKTKAVPGWFEYDERYDYPVYLRKKSVLEVFKENSNINRISNIFDNPELLEGGTK